MAEISDCSIGFNAKRGILHMFFQVKTTAFIKTEVFASLFLHELVHHIANARRSVDLFSFPSAELCVFHKASFVSFMKTYHTSVLVTKPPLSSPAKQSCHVACFRSEPCWFKVGTTAPKRGFWDVHCLSSPGVYHTPGQGGWLYSLEGFVPASLPVEPFSSLHCSSLGKDACSRRNVILGLWNPCSPVTPGIVSQRHTVKLNPESTATPRRAYL